MRLDVAIGMGLVQLIMWSVITTTAVSLHDHGIIDIQTADQAASALQPLVSTFPYAGVLSETIFALGLIGTGLLAIPVMAAASAYAQEIYTSKQILCSNSHIYYYRTMDKFCKYRPH